MIPTVQNTVHQILFDKHEILKKSINLNIPVFITLMSIWNFSYDFSFSSGTQKINV